MRSVLTRGAAAMGIGLGMCLLGPALAASAHVTASAADRQAGAYTVVTLSVPHGCEGAPTTKVAVRIPEGINAVTPTRNAFWDVTKVTGRLATPIKDSHGKEVSERVDQIVFTARTPLPADQRDTFELSLQLPAAAAGTTLYFPTVQTCERGESAWVQIPAAGQNAHDLALPAPSVAVAAPGSGSDSPGGQTPTTQPTGNQSSQSSHDSHGAQPAAQGAGLGLTITALVLGALGVVVGAAALVTARRR